MFRGQTVCVSGHLSLSVYTLMSPAKTDEPIEVPFEAWTVDSGGRYGSGSARVG